MGTRQWSRTWLTLAAGILIVVVAGVGAAIVAIRSGALENRVTYWRERSQDCGLAARRVQGMMMDTSGARKAVLCFEMAYTACKAARISRGEDGLDTSATYVFVVEPRGNGQGCDVGLHVDGGGVSGHQRVSVDGQCTQAAVGYGSLTFLGCDGYGNINVP